MAPGEFPYLTSARFLEAVSAGDSLAGRVVAEAAEHGAGDRARVLLLDAPHHHAEVPRFADHSDAFGIEHPLDGFGYLIPSREKRRILGTLWDSSIFPNRAPQGYVLLRSMVGGARAERLAMLDDEKLINTVRDELAARVAQRERRDRRREAHVGAVRARADR